MVSSLYIEIKQQTNELNQLVSSYIIISITSAKSWLQTEQEH
jgi:hypothetical protein